MRCYRLTSTQLLKFEQLVDGWRGLACFGTTQKLLPRLGLAHQRGYEYRKSDIWSGLFLGS